MAWLTILPSITGTITAIFLCIGLSKEPFTKAPTSAFWIMVGSAIYEVMQPTLGTGVFDYQDLTAVVITGFIIIYALKKIWFVQQDNKRQLSPPNSLSVA